MSDRRPIATLCVVLAAATACACSPPTTDIVATNTEATGDYRVIDARRDGGLFLRACVVPGGDHDHIGARITQQLLNHAYPRVEIELLEPAADARSASVTRFTWTPGTGPRSEGRTRSDQNPCTPAGEHGASG
jgi:hypothetical protein